MCVTARTKDSICSLVKWADTAFWLCTGVVCPCCISGIAGGHGGAGVTTFQLISLILV